MRVGRADAPVVLGRICGLFGVKGWVKVFSYTDPREAVLGYRSWLIRAGNGWRPVQVAEGKRQGKTVVARFVGINDRDEAAALLECDIGVNREQLPQPGDGRYYWSDLEGMRVLHRDGTELGTVAYVMATGANDVLVVQGDRERLIPFVADEVILDVDLDNAVINVDWEWE